MFERGRRLLIQAGKKTGQRVVAIALRKGRITGIGYNNYDKTHPRQRDLARIAGQPKREYLHAEIAALLRSRDIPDELFVVRLNRRDETCLAKPCPVCSYAISLVNPRMKVFHT